jgi:hypothetical protein
VPSLEFLSGIATITASLVAIPGIIVGVMQLRASTRAEKASARAYVSVQYIISKPIGKGESVYLVFRNHGRVVAENIRLTFENETGWNHISNSESLPFVTDAGISRLYPDQYAEYFVGTLQTKSRLLKLKESDVKATLTFKDSIFGMQSVKISLGLADYKYRRRAT